MSKHIVKCLLCGQSFDTNEEDYKTEGRRYMHKECYERQAIDRFFIDDIHMYISHIYGGLYSKARINKQIKEMVDDGKTVEEIDKVLKYWYSVKGNDPSKSQGSIRIVNYVYDEALNYYQQMSEYKKANTGVNIKEILNNEVQNITIKPKPIGKPRKVKLFDLR